MTNKELIERYPWLTPFNRFSGKLITDCAGPDGEEGYWPGNPTAHPDYDYDFTELDNLADGWRKAFGERMCEEIDGIVKSWPEERRKNFRIMDIKEKWGHLCIYTNYIDSDINKIISKYSLISEFTCIHCGEPAHWITRGWYMPICDKCAREAYDNKKSKVSFKFEDEYIDIDEYYKMRTE